MTTGRINQVAVLTGQTRADRIHHHNHLPSTLASLRGRPQRVRPGAHFSGYTHTRILQAALQSSTTQVRELIKAHSTCTGSAAHTDHKLGAPEGTKSMPAHKAHPPKHGGPAPSQGEAQQVSARCLPGDTNQAFPSKMFMFHCSARRNSIPTIPFSGALTCFQEKRARTDTPQQGVPPAFQL
uniref:Uncharacterized protein n=1 Tax=Amphora coffeiformis TaxID=265554 RepID=A0A6S8KCJ5_9STRA|mmetsp:Transcript_7870/g.14990  ORF Transcript_7870/g.14990 Transcript_7870/m.14990 type:complete len:182 (-) Transcript_7870:557-1102(-)